MEATVIRARRAEATRIRQPDSAYGSGCRESLWHTRVQEIDEPAQASEVEAVEGKDQAWQRCCLVIVLFGELGAHLEAAAGGDVGEVALQAFEERRLRRSRQTQHEPVTDVTGRVVHAIEAADL